MVLPIAAAFAGGHAIEGFGLLMVGMLQLAAVPRTFGLGGCAHVVGPLEDPVELVLGERRQEGQDAAIRGPSPMRRVCARAR